MGYAAAFFLLGVPRRKNGGGDRDRTDDLSVAKAKKTKFARD